jgi:hypothetical protein
MSHNEYHINLLWKSRQSALLLSTIPLFFVCILYIEFLGLFCALAIPAMYLILAFTIFLKKFTTAKIYIKLHEESVSFVWKKSFLFCNDEDVHINFDDICEYKIDNNLLFSGYNNTAYFNITYKENKKLELETKINNLKFSEFIHEFEDKIKAYNHKRKFKSENNEETKLHYIKKAKTFIEGPNATFLFVICIIITVCFVAIIPYSIYTGKFIHPSAIGSFLGVLTYIVYYLTIRKKKKRRG